MDDISNRVRELEIKAEKAVADIKTLQDRCTEHGKEIDSLQISNASMSTTLSRIDTTVSKIDEKLDASNAKPAQRWDDLVKQVISIVVAAIVGLALMKVGLQ